MKLERPESLGLDSLVQTVSPSAIPDALQKMGTTLSFVKKTALQLTNTPEILVLNTGSVSLVYKRQILGDIVKSGSIWQYNPHHYLSLNGEICFTVHPQSTIWTIPLQTLEQCGIDVSESRDLLTASWLSQNGIAFFSHHYIIDQLQQENELLLEQSIEHSQAISRHVQLIEDSNRQLEGQNTLLKTTSTKLQTILSSKQQILKKLCYIEEVSIPPIRTLLESIKPNNQPEALKTIKQVLHHIDGLQDAFKPFSMVPNYSQFTGVKRILLAEDDKKQQTIAKLALNGTRVALDVVDTVDEGKKMLDSVAYDIVCFNGNFAEVGSYAHSKFPDIKSLFFTEMSSRKYLDHMKELGFISNIVARNADDRTFTITNIISTIGKLVTNNIFGLEKYLHWGVDVHEQAVTDSETRRGTLESLGLFLNKLGIRSKIKTHCISVAEELLMNVIYDAPVDADGKSIYNHLPRTAKVFLKPEEYGLFRFACDGIMLAISAEDPFGRFKKATVVNYLESCYTDRAGKMNEQMGKGGAGRGLFHIIESTDLLIINVRNKKRTEVIALFDLNVKKIRHRGQTSFHYFLD